MNRAELKANAKRQIKGNIGILFLCFLIFYLIYFAAGFVLEFIPFGNLVSTFIILPAFALSIAHIYLNLTVGTKPAVGDIFCGFDDFWSAFKVTFLTALFVFLWSLLLIIPGIVKAYSYYMSVYILAENKGKPALECISESKELTNGHKMDLFVLELSFIGWGLLCIVTLGIAAIWVTPYMGTTIANAYQALKAAKQTSCVE